MLIKKWGQNFVITLSSIWIFSGCHQWYIFINCIEILVEIVKTVWAAVCGPVCTQISALRSLRCSSWLHQGLKKVCTCWRVAHSSCDGIQSVADHLSRLQIGARSSSRPVPFCAMNAMFMAVWTRCCREVRTAAELWTSSCLWPAAEPGSYGTSSPKDCGPEPLRNTLRKSSRPGSPRLDPHTTVTLSTSAQVGLTRVKTNQSCARTTRT